MDTATQASDRSPTKRRPREHPARRGTLVALALLASALMGLGVASPPRGSDAPAIKLKDLDGSLVTSARLAPRTLLIVFGELANEGTRQACADALDVLADPRLSGEAVVPVLIVAQDASPDRLKEEALTGRFPALILHDPRRDAFAAYRVLVVPTIVVVNPKGKVAYAMPGFVPRFKEILAGALLTSVGTITDAQFEQLIDPKSRAAAPETVRAERLAHLGHELARQGLYDLAEARYAQALRIAPGHTGAKVGLGELMLRQDRVDDAEPVFDSVLAGEPDSIDAALGIAVVQIRRGGQGLGKAEASVRGILGRNPTHARAHYLMGQVQEKKGDTAQAAQEYRKAAEILLRR